MYRKPEVKSIGNASELILGDTGEYQEVQGTCIDSLNPDTDPNVVRDGGVPQFC